MQGIRDFIIEIKVPYKDKKRLSDDVSVYIDERFSHAESTNKHAFIVSTPIKHKTNLKKGDEVFIDTSNLMKQIYKGVRHDSFYLVDKSKGWFRIEPGLIIAYKKGDTWIGYGEHNLIQPIEVKRNEKIGEIYIPESKIEKQKKGKARASIINESLASQGVAVGDCVALSPYGEIPYELEGEMYWNAKNEDILAVIHE